VRGAGSVTQEWRNVTVEKAANIYFDGRVTSRTAWLHDGSKITLGIMLPGKYEFHTNSMEVIDVISGEMEFLLSGETLWREISGRGTFSVPAHSSFKVKIHSVTDYCCSYGSAACE